MSRVYCGAGLPRGQGEPVLVIPGFLAGDHVMLEMHRWLGRIGYRAHRARIYFNTDCPNSTAQTLVSRARAIHEKSGQRVRLVGHSLGGMLAKCVAQMAPQHVDRVITMGSPFRDLVKAHPAVVGLWEQIKSEKSSVVGRNLRPSCATGHCVCEFVAAMLEPKATDIPQFAIFSKNDGVVEWKSCVEEDDARNSEVDCSHIGMAFHPGAFEALARRLAERV